MSAFWEDLARDLEDPVFRAEYDEATRDIVAYNHARAVEWAAEMVLGGDSIGWAAAEYGVTADEIRAALDAMSLSKRHRDNLELAERFAGQDETRVAAEVEIVAALDRLDGTEATAVAHATGLDRAELDDLGGLPG